MLDFEWCIDQLCLVFLLFSPLLISEFTRTLLEHFIKQTDCPPTIAVAPLNDANGDSGTLYKIGQSVACK